MGDPTFTITDTETGGLDETRNPLLSIATLVCDEQLNELANYYTRIRPPRGTVLEVPAETREDRTMGNYRARIMWWYDLYNGTTFETKPPGPVISAGAAMVNGFIKPDANGSFEWWDLKSCEEWMTDSVALGDADRDLAIFLTSHFPQSKPVNIAYNVDFDVKFVREHAKLAFAAMGETWVCAMKATQKAVKTANPSARSGWKLSDAARMAGITNPSAHEALGDVRTTRPVVKWLQEGGFI